MSNLTKGRHFACQRSTFKDVGSRRAFVWLFTRDTETSIAKVESTSNLKVPARMQFDSLKVQTGGKPSKYLSFYFEVGRVDINAAYTFAFHEGENPLDTLIIYSSKLALLSSSDRGNAFRDYVQRLRVGEGLLRAN